MINSNSRMYVIGPDGNEAFELAASRYEKEADFQTLLAKHPALLDGHQFDPVTPRRWLLVGQEVAVPDAGSDRWSLDHLFIDQDGIATLVEVKRKSDTRLRREVVGQMLDYAANGSIRWTSGSLSDAFIAQCGIEKVDPEMKLSEFLGDQERVASFWGTVESNLRAGRMRLLFVADEIPEELLRIVEFMNERMSPTEVLALELRYFSGQGYSTHVPRLLGRTVAAIAQKEISGSSGGMRRTWNRDEFLEDARSRLESIEWKGLVEFLDQCASLFEIAWGTGSKRGSFTPRRHDVSARGPITVYSDGKLDIKASWLRDTDAAVAWRDRIVPRFLEMGWEQPDGENKEVTLTLDIKQWLPRANEILEAIR
jgi:hypothetical protein